MQNQSYISHHGILGMKWGKRNGPPYPLGIEDHSSSEKKANWMDSLSSKRRKKIAKELTRKSNYFERKKYPYESARHRDIPEIKRVFKDLSRAREEYRKAHKLSEEYWHLSDDKMLEYQNKAWKKACEFSKQPYEPLKKDDYFRWDDWDQGENSSYDIFCKEHGSSAEKEWGKSIKALDVYNSAQKKAVDQLLREYGDRPSGMKYNETAKEVANDALWYLRLEDESRRKYGVVV